MIEPTNSAAFLMAEKAYPLEVKEAPYHTPVDNEIIIKIAAIAINPAEQHKFFLTKANHHDHRYLLTSSIPSSSLQVTPPFRHYPITPQSPLSTTPLTFVLSHDCAGTVVVLGPTAPTTYRIGDRVLGLGLGFGTRDASRGTFQRYIKLSPPLVARLLPALPFVDAAVLPLGTATAAAGLFEEGILGLLLPKMAAKDQVEVSAKKLVVTLYG